MTQENVSNQGKGAIFDLDGTLLDSLGVWDQVDVDFLADRRIHDRTLQPVGHSWGADGGVGSYGARHVLHGGRSQAARA